MSPEQQQRMREILGEERFRELMERQKEQKKGGESYEEESFSDDEMRLIDEILEREERTRQDEPQKKKGGFGGKGFGGGAKGDYRNFSPDKKLYAFVKNDNLYVAEAGKEDEAIQLTKDGNEDYTFTGGFGSGGNIIRDQKDDKRDQKDDNELHDYGKKEGDTEVKA